jgi:predicted PurR-regulated permease PerM
VILLAFSGFGALAWVGVEQFAGIVTDLPHYQANIQRKLNALRNPATARLSAAIGSLENMASQLSPQGKADEKAQKGQTPIPVQVVRPHPSVWDSLGLVGGSIAFALTTSGAVVVFTLFMLLKRVDLRNRLFGLFGLGRINQVTLAMDDAAKRVSRYLFMLLTVNSLYGVLLGTGLYFIGVPYPIFWGVSAIFIRFIPYVGALTILACPFILSLAVSQGWQMPLLVLGLWVLLEGTVSSLLEPYLYGSQAGISSLAILISAVFWTMLWGPIGLVLSTPLTVCLVVLGRHVPRLQFLYILMGDEPVLAPHASYYQRLLALDEDEARSVFENFAKGKSDMEVFEALLIPALSLAEQDRHEGSLDEDQQRLIYGTTRELTEELTEVSEEVNAAIAQPRCCPLSILCVPARDEADELVAIMAADVLYSAGYEVKTTRAAFMKDLLATITRERPDVLIISALPPFAVSHARSLCRKARQRMKGLKVVIGLWNTGAEQLGKMREDLGTGCSEYVVSSLSQLELQLKFLTEHNEEQASEESSLSPASAK